MQIGKILCKSTKKLAHIQKKAYFCTEFQKQPYYIWKR